MKNQGKHKIPGAAQNPTYFPEIEEGWPHKWGKCRNDYWYLSPASQTIKSANKGVGLPTSYSKTIIQVNQNNAQTVE